MKGIKQFFTPKYILGLLIIFLLCFSIEISAYAAATDSPTSNISSFKLDLISGVSSAPDSNWYSINGGAIMNNAIGRRASGDRQNRVTGGDVSYSPVTLVGPMIAGGARADLIAILNDWAQGKGSRWNSTLTLVDLDGSNLKRLDYIDCIPLDYHPPSTRAGDSSLLEEEFTYRATIVDEDAAGIAPPPEKPFGPVTTAGDPTDTILASKNFSFEIDDAELSVTEVIPGDMYFKIAKRRGRRRGRNANGPNKFFVIKSVNYGEWEIKKSLIKGDAVLKNLFDEFVRAAAAKPSGIKATLYYLDSFGTVQRAITAHNIVPVSYDSCSVDSRNEMVASETLRFRVEYCTFE